MGVRMKVNDCDICGGRGTVRFPVRQKMNIGVDLGEGKTSPLSESLPIREYPCPECGYKIPQDKILIVQAEELIDAEYIKRDGQKFVNYIKEALVRRLATEIFEQNQINFTLLPPTDDLYCRKLAPMRAKLGIISPRIVATFEQRVNERQQMIAQEVIKEAVQRINNFGSHYEWKEIRKESAIREIYEALQKVLKDTAI